MAPRDQLPLFVVEDSDDDLFLFRRLLAKAAVKNPIGIATNGQAAIDQLAVLAEQSDAAKIPAIVFLDLKLPLRSGFEVLEWLRAQPAFRRTVVIVLSSSAEARDVKRAYDSGAQGYLVKYPAASIFAEVLDKVARTSSESELSALTFPGMARPA